MNQANQNTATASTANPMATSTAVDPQQSRRKADGQSGNNFLSHSISPTNSKNQAAIQQQMRKKSLNIKMGNLNTKGSLQQPQIIRNLKKQANQQDGVDGQMRGNEGKYVGHLAKLPTNDKIMSIIKSKNKQYQKNRLKGQQVSQGGLLLGASQTTENNNSCLHSFAEPKQKVKSKRMAAGSTDDLERTPMHYQTMHVSRKEESVIQLLDGPEKQSHQKFNQQINTMGHSKNSALVNSAYMLKGANAESQPLCTNDHRIDDNNSQHLSAQQQYRLQCCSSRTTSNETPYRNSQIDQIFRSNTNELSLRNKDLASSIKNKRSNSPSDGQQFTFMHSHSMRQASSRQQNKLYQSKDSSLERDENCRPDLQKKSLRLQRQSSCVSDENQQNQLPIQSQDISKQIIRKSVIASTQKLILNPKQIIYADESSSSLLLEKADDKQPAHEEGSYANKRGGRPEGGRADLMRNEQDLKRRLSAPINNFESNRINNTGAREESVDGKPVVQEWEHVDPNQIGHDDPSNDNSTVQKVRFRMSKLNQSKKFSTPVDHISPQESDPASSAEISPTKLKQEDGSDNQIISSSDGLRQPKHYMMTEADVAQPPLGSSDLNRTGLAIKQIQSDDPYDQPKHVRGEGRLNTEPYDPTHAVRGSTHAGDRSKLLNFQSPSSIKIIDLRQPNVRKQLMDSLQELVKERKFKMHQRESWQFNDKYDAIIKNTIQNRRVNIEKSIPPPPPESHEYDHFGVVAGNMVDMSSLGEIIAGGPSLDSGSAGFVPGGQHLNTQFFDEASVQLPNLNEPFPEQSIISRSDLSAQLKIQAEKAQSQTSGKTVTKKQSLSQLEMNFQNGGNMNVAHGDKQGLITPRQRQRLITKLNEIYEAQLLNDAQEGSPSQCRSPMRDAPLSVNNNQDDMIFDAAINDHISNKQNLSPLSESRPPEQIHDGYFDEVHKAVSEQHSPFVGNIISVINNDKLYYIANDAPSPQSQMSRFIQIQQQFSQNSSMPDKSMNDEGGAVAVENELLLASQNTVNSVSGNRPAAVDGSDQNIVSDESLGTNEQNAIQNFSRNTNKFDSQQVMVQQVSTDQQTNFIQQADLISLKNYQKYIKKEYNQMRDRVVTKMPSVSDLTFFDLSNPLHLNQLFTRLGDIQQQEIEDQDNREMPKALQRQSKIDEQINDDKHAQMQQSGYNSPQVQQEQSGEESGNVSSHQTHTPIHSRQGVEQAHAIDVDLLIQKLLKVPNVDVLDSIFAVDSEVTQRLDINLQPSNGTGNSGETNNIGGGQASANQISTKEMIQRVTGNIQDILNFKPQAGESSLSSGGHASEIQSSGMMTPKSQKSLSTPNQIKLLQERNFNIQGFRFPMHSINSRGGGTDSSGNQQIRDSNFFYPPAAGDDHNQIQSGGIIDQDQDGYTGQQMNMGKQLMDTKEEGQVQCHDLMSPMTKKLLMQKLKEVQEQIGDSQSNDSLSDNEQGNPNNPASQLSRNIVDGVVAGSQPDPQIFGTDKNDPQKRNKHLKSFYDPQTGAIVQRALDNTRHHKTKLIISQIDEEDENLQFDEDEEMIQQEKESRDANNKIKLNTLFEPSPRNMNQEGEYPLSNLIGQANQNYLQIESQSSQFVMGQVPPPDQSQIQEQAFNYNGNNMPQIDLLIQKLKQLEIQQRLKASEHQHSSGSQKGQNLNIQRQSLSHGTSNNQSQSNIHDSSQATAALVMQSNSCDQAEAFHQDSQQSSKGDSNCQSPLKVGNINIYNMPKNPELNMQLRRSQGDQKHKVSHQSINYNIGWQHLSQASSSPEHQYLQEQPFQANNEVSLFGAIRHQQQQQRNQVQLHQQLDSSMYGNNIPKGVEQHQLSEIMSRNHSVANILEQVIKRLEGLKSKD